MTGSLLKKRLTRKKKGEMMRTRIGWGGQTGSMTWVSLIIVIAGVMGFSQPSYGGDAQRIQVLEDEVKTLREQINRVVSPPIPDETTPPKLHIRGFGNVDYQYVNRTQETTNNFANGAVDLFITSQISRKLSFLNETLFEFGEGGENILDVERVLLKYEHADWLNLSGGRGHTALGYWNERFHHGTFLQTTIERPTLFNFEDDGGILPVHFVGIQATGNIDLPFGMISYSANVANGRGTITDEVQLIEDLNDSKQVGGMVTFAPYALEGWNIGANVLVDRIPDDPGIRASIDETIYGAHLYYVTHPFEFIWEHQFIEHDASDNLGGYLQVAYALERLKPYYRIDYRDIEEGDAFFAASEDAGVGTIEDLVKHTIGLNYSMTTWSNVKVEYRYLDATSTNANELGFQISFAF